MERLLITPPAVNGHGAQTLGAALNGWGRLLGIIGVPGAIALYLVWWLTQALGARLDRMIDLLETIARAVKAHAA